MVRQVLTFLPRVVGSEIQKRTMVPMEVAVLYWAMVLDCQQVGTVGLATEMHRRIVGTLRQLR